MPALQVPWLNSQVPYPQCVCDFLVTFLIFRSEFPKLHHVRLAPVLTDHLQMQLWTVNISPCPTFAVQREKSMDLQSIVEQLKSERDRINQAIAALEGVRTPVGRAARTARKGHARRRRLSAEARRRISEAQKKRWAHQRKQKKS